MHLDVLYFASLRDAAGVERERIATEEGSLRALYASLQKRYGFRFTPEQLRVAVDGEFARWDDALRADSEVVFMPPVSGG
jgi:molybdopterin synthase sulfur carrier subunit